jgi:uncharacterized protein (TIGR02145 family)
LPFDCDEYLIVKNMAVEISDTNYNGLSCSVTLYAATGNTIPYTNATQIPLGTKTIPFTYSSSTVSNEYGTFSCFYSFLNKTCTSSLLTPPDGDGNRYKTIKIGEQVWMSENLKTTSFLNTTQVSPQTWTAANITQAQYWSWVANNSIYTANYGLLYNQFAVTGATLCPSGWSIPSDSDFTTLRTFLGNSAGYEVASTTLWNFPLGTNTSGFNIVPAGLRGFTGSFNGIGALAYLWSSSENIGWFLDGASFYAATNSDPRSGFSVRCIKDL